MNADTSMLEPLIEEIGVLEAISVASGSLSLSEQHTWDAQQTFLGFMASYGVIQKSCQLSGVNRESVRRWRNDDVLGFADRFAVAREAYGESLETMVHDRLAEPQGNRGSDILLMFQAKAEMPEKYREEVKIIDTGPTKDLLDQLRRLGQAKVVEGTLAPGEVPAKVVDTSLLHPTTEPSPEASEAT